MKKTLQVINEMEKDGVIHRSWSATLLKRSGNNILSAKNKRHIERLFLAKKQRRMELAKLSIEEKVKILVQLQQIACFILNARGLKREPWRI